MDETKNVTEAPKFKSIIKDERGENIKSFVANGTTYFIQTEICYDRWIKYRKLQVELGYATTFKEIFDELTLAFNLLDEQRLAQSAVTINSVLMGMEQVADEDQVPTVIALCAMFINASGEDVTTISEAMIKGKRDDWRKEPIPVSDFFALALHSIPGFMEIYKNISQSTSSSKNKSEGKREHQ